MVRKVRAINKSDNDKKKILTLNEQGLKPSDIYAAFQGKYTYWQIYNTISPRDAKSGKLVKEDGSIESKKLKAERTVTEMPDVDYSDFPSFEKFLEHEITVVISQLNEKKVTIEKRTFILNKLADINKKLKAQLVESHLKNPDARIIISLMRRMKPDISDEEIIRIYKEESERIKKDGK
jgi:hypothetical protein